MTSETLAPEHGLATVLVAMPTPTEGQPSDDQRPGTLHHAEILARLLDFPGGVKLSERFGLPVPTDEATDPMAPLLAERLSADVRARLESLERAVLKPLNGRRAPRPPAADALWATLERAGVLQAPSDPATTAALARELGQPYRAALAAAIRQAQAQLATLRWEIQHDLRALGPRAALLERFDSLLNAGMQAQVGKLYDRLEAALAQTFAQACRRAVSALPTPPRPQDVAPWLEADGWLERYRARCEQVARAVFSHGRRNLLGLLHAAELSTARDDGERQQAPADEATE